jgi:acetyl esterase/lipase
VRRLSLHLKVMAPLLSFILPILLALGIGLSASIRMTASDDKIVEGVSPSSNSIKVVKRTDRAVITHVFQKLIRPFGPSLVKPKKKYPPGSPQLDVPSKIQKHCHVAERRRESIWLYDITAKKASDRMRFDKGCKHRIYYFAGGGWQSPPSSHHWKVFASLVTRLPHTVLTVVSYPLGPNSPAPVAIPQLLKLYAALMQESLEAGETVTFAGDSAGGNVVLCLVLEALRLDPKGPQPHSILALSPSVELGRHNPNISDVEKHDPILRVPFIQSTAKAWYGAGREDAWIPADSRVSPIEADLNILRDREVFVDGITAGYDILGPDAVVFREKLRTAGVEGEWLEWDKMMHCFPLAAVYGLFPESREAFDWIVDLMKRRSSGG